MTNYNWNYPTTIWVGKNRINDLNLACNNLKIKNRVKKGDVLLKLEAMKMEYSLIAPRDGIIKEIFCKNGEQVTENFKLLNLEKIK